ncbi:MAG: hypothetical protein JSR82_01535 [Verrucomicrobia bacterium]|nr:hypothetical protein [Verrucomicrobiota bacterium]
MALTINLLHEQQKLERQKQLDPLKLGTYLIASIVAFFVVYYVYEYISSQSAFGQRDDLRAQWSKKEKEISGIAQAETEARTTIAQSTLLSYRIENRFYWGPFLECLTRNVPPEVQIVSLSGVNIRKSNSISVTLDGLAAGAEPRAAAEKFRNTLIAGIGKCFERVSVNFRTLDESGGTAKVDDKDLPTARFSLRIEFVKPHPPEPPAPTPTPTPRRGTR